MTWKSTLNTIPNLSGHIKILSGPVHAGGCWDVYISELVYEVMATDPVSVGMQMLHILNKEASVSKAKKVGEYTPFSPWIHSHPTWKFRKEVSIWCFLRHPNALPFYGTCDFDQFRPFMVSMGGGRELAGLSSMQSYCQTQPTCRCTFGSIIFVFNHSLDVLSWGKCLCPWISSFRDRYVRNHCTWGL